MDRSDVITLPPDTDWLRDVDAQAVCAAVSAEGGHVYFVGGCVRDALLGVAGSDVDMATEVVPADVTRLARAAGLKVIPTGFDHGTVTVVASGKGYEITSFREDVRTDGRHAEVAFSQDIAQDAKRRDFTLNALYATPDGRVIDPLGGMPDCLNRRIKFIEDADARIREDYLRILRYFRFHAWYAPDGAGFDTEALAAIAQNTAGLETLSAERIGAEMVKLLSAPNPGQALAGMRATGCLMRILPGSDDRLMDLVLHLEQTIHAAPDPMLRLAALGGEDPVDRLRLSRTAARHVRLLSEAGFGGKALAEIAYRHGVEVAHGTAILRSALAQAPIMPDDLTAIAQAARAVFPLRAKDLMPELKGKALGDKLAALEADWIASGFAKSRDDLLSG